jgi:hypothetical protein
MIEKEIWAEIKSLPGFHISSFGRIKKDRFLYKRNCKDRFLKRTKAGNYFYFCCYPYKNPDRLPVHSTVLKSFVGNPPEGFECHHKDGNTEKNCLSNLEWIPIKNNRSHLGSKNGSSKLKEGEVWLIKRILASGILRRKSIAHVCLSKMFKVDRRTIRRIEDGEKWKQIVL